MRAQHTPAACRVTIPTSHGCDRIPIYDLKEWPVSLPPGPGPTVCDRAGPAVRRPRPGIRSSAWQALQVIAQRLPAREPGSNKRSEADLGVLNMLARRTDEGRWMGGGLRS
eukprot:144101-Hanusia_phi.AAC.8